MALEAVTLMAARAAADSPMRSSLSPRLRYWLDRLTSEQVLEAAVVYGYFRCVSEGNDLVILGESGAEREHRLRVSAEIGGFVLRTFPPARERRG